MIRSTKHHLDPLNVGKTNKLTRFLDEYRRVGQWMIDKIWADGYQEFSVQNDKLKLPKYLEYKDFEIETSLSARSKSSLCTQVSGHIRSATRKREKTLWVIDKLTKDGKDTSRLQKKLSKLPLVKPTMPECAELSSKCTDIVKEGSFGWFLRVKSTGFGDIKIPIRNHERSQYWLERGGIVVGSFLIRKQTVEIRFDIPTKKKSGTKAVAIDQGVKTVATFSDGTSTPDRDCHGHNFDSICDKLTRKKKGSKAFKATQDHRKNFINWSLNQICWETFAEVRLEKIVNIGFGKRRSRKLQHFTNTLIRDKIKRSCEEWEVPVIEQDSSYRSQRCSKCGIVRKANRKGKGYSCKHCGFSCDADLNAAKNHIADLPDVTALRGQKLNLGNGFYWNPTGFTTFDGRELRVPDSSRKTFL